jgi:error-prone DNA polymerase
MPDRNPYDRPSHFLSGKPPSASGSAPVNNAAGTITPFPKGGRDRAKPRPEAPACAELLAASNVSFLRGASHPEELATAARDLGLAGLAVTDRNSLAGVVRAHAAAKETGLKSVVGCRLVFADGTPDIAAWVTDRAAYGRLCRLLSQGNLRMQKGDCHLTLADLVNWGKGLELAVLPDRRIGGNLAPTLRTLRQAFAGSVRLGATCLYHGDNRRRLAECAAIAGQTNVPLIALGDVLYHVAARRPLQDVLTCIREHVTLDTAGRLLEANAERHLKAPAEIARLFKDVPDAVTETLAILERLSFSFDELRYEYPEEPTGQSATPFDELTRLTFKGAGNRYPHGVPDKVKKSLDHELALIRQLDYAPYFLTVWDIVRFARSEGILCQGRGSAANSAVCYCLGITEVDPDRSDLLFERFISAERREPPDIDVDFEHARREEVIQYVYGKYGHDRAGIAATVITYRSRSASREVGKAFGLSEDAVAALSGNIWGWSSTGVDESDARRAGLDAADPRVEKVLALTREIIGFPRHLSQHVGGFIITRGRLDEVVPVLNSAMDGRTIIEWDKDDLDALGILKIDVLALGMLTCMKKALTLLDDHYGVELSLATIPPEDPETYDMICRADTIGVFQIESRAQMTMLPRLRPRNFYDLVVEVAIVRPGPIQGNMVHPYLKRRRNPKAIRYPAPAPEHGQPDELERVLGKTLGVPLFQEQAMQIAIVAARFTPGEADRLRRAMATFRRVGTIHTFQAKMVQGMIARGYDPDFAERCFRQIEGFGEYGFPESHAASFALLVYTSSWVKCHYPDIFCAALLNAQPMGFYAPAQIVRDAREHGVEVRPVDINHSAWESTLEPVRENSEGIAGRIHARHAKQAPAIRTRCAVRLGLRQIKGLREADVQRLIATRGPIKTGKAGKVGYKNVRDLWLRSGLARASLERLADADAFRSIGLDRRKALWQVRALNEAGAAEHLPLFDGRDDGGADDFAREAPVLLPRMPLGEHVVNDYRSIRLSLKAHPVSFVRDELVAMGIAKAECLADWPNGRRIRVAGLVLVRQRPGSAKGVIFATLEDETGIANIIVWPKAFERYRPVVIGARFIAVTGRVQSGEGVIHVVADKIDDLTPLLAKLSEGSIGDGGLARADEVRRPIEDMREKFRPRSRLADLLKKAPELIADLQRLARAAGRVMPKGRNFH